MKKTLFTMALLLAALTLQAQDEKQTFTRKILLEQFTTVNCGYCPPGADRITSAIGTASNIIWIKHHAGFGTDFLTNDVHQELLALYAGSTFAPAMTVDRTRFDESRPGPVGSVGQISDIRTLFASAKQVATYCKVIAPEITYNPSTRKVTGQVRVRFGDEVWDANTRITVFLIEDSIVGSQNDYTDHGNWTNYVHMGTVRAALTEIWGDNLEVDAQERTAVHQIDYTLPTTYEHSHCRLVALVTNHDANDINNRKVLNAAESAFLDEVPQSTEGIGEMAGTACLRLFPNPASGQVVLESDGAILSVQIYNALGQQVYQSRPEGAMQSAVNTSLFPQGVYVVRIRTVQGVAERRVAVTH